MENIGRAIALRLGIKKANAFGVVFGASVAAIVAAGVVFAAITVSNMLTFGPSHVGLAVELTKTKDLPSSISVGQKNEVKFTIEATDQVSGAILWFQLRAQGVNLNDPTIVEVEYKHPGDSSKSISVTPADGNLKGALQSGWNISEDFDDTGEIEITFLSNAPTASYFVDLWVEGTMVSASSSTPASNTGQGEQSQGQSFTLDAHSDGFSGVSGTNVNGVSIDGITNPTLTVKAGVTNEITAVWQNSIHDIAIYAQPCEDGFCNAPIAQSSDLRANSPQANITFSFPTAGETFYFICDYHPDKMKGIITVVQ